MKQQVRFGLIGTGRIGQVHAAHLHAHPQATLSWIADTVFQAAQNLAEKYGATATASPVDLIHSNEVDAVLIASPTPTHIDLIEACIDAKVPVLCEKPIDIDIHRVDSLRHKAHDSITPIALGFNQRFDPYFAEVKNRVVSGEIGNLEMLSIVSRDPGPPPADYIKVSGGIFRDMSIHDIDMARFFMGDIELVSAVGSQLFDQGAKDHSDFDTVALTLRSSSGAIATIVNSRHSAVGYDQRLEAVGPRGMLQVPNMPSSLVSLSTAESVDAKAPYLEFFLERYDRAYAAEIDEFLKLVRGEESSSPTFEDGRSALLIADAAQKSAETGSAVRVKY